MHGSHRRSHAGLTSWSRSHRILALIVVGAWTRAYARVFFKSRAFSIMFWGYTELIWLKFSIVETLEDVTDSMFRSHLLPPKHNNHETMSVILWIESYLTRMDEAVCVFIHENIVARAWGECTICCVWLFLELYLLCVRLPDECRFLAKWLGNHWPTWPVYSLYIQIIHVHNLS